MNRVLILVSGGVAEVAYTEGDIDDVIIFDEDKNDDDFSRLPRWAQEALIEHEEEG